MTRQTGMTRALAIAAMTAMMGAPPVGDDDEPGARPERQDDGQARRHLEAAQAKRERKAKRRRENDARANARPRTTQALQLEKKR